MKRERGRDGEMSELGIVGKEGNIELWGERKQRIGMNWSKWMK